MTMILTMTAFLIQSTLLLTFGLLVGGVLGRNRAVLRQAVLRMTLIAVLILPVISLLFPKLGAPGLAVYLPDLVQITENVAEVAPDISAAIPTQVPHEIMAEPTPVAMLPVTESQSESAGINFAQNSNDERSLQNNSSRERSSPKVNGVTGESGIEQASPVTSFSHVVTSFRSRLLFQSVILAVWGLGMLFFAVRLIRSQRRAASLIRAAVTVDPALMSRLATCAEGLGVKKPVRLLQCPFLSSPCLLGIRRPTMLLPDDLPQQERELDAILVHELAHLVRGDIAWLLLARIVTAIAFFQPLLWVIKRKIHQTSEEICDDEVLRFGINSRAYAEQLLEVASKFVPGETLPDCVLTMASRKSRLRLRVERILDSSRVLSVAVSRKSLLCIAAVVLLLTLITGSFSIEVARDTNNDNHALAMIETQTETVIATPAERTVIRRVPVLSSLPVIGNLFTYNTIVREEPQQPPTKITCRVLDPDDNPISGAKVIVQLLREDSTRELKVKHVARYRITTNSKGEYFFFVMNEQAADPELRVHIAAAHPDYISLGFIFEKYQNFLEAWQLPDNEQRTTITLTPSAKVTGKVLTPDGKPAKSVLVYASSGDLNSVQTNTRTDAEGNYTIGTQLAKSEEEYYKDRLVYVLPKDYAPLAVVLNDEDADLGVLQLQEGVVLKGRAVDAHGKPVPNLWISLLLNDSPGVRRHGHDASCRAAVSDAEGWFQFRPVMPGEYHIDTGLLMEYDRDDWQLAPESAYVNLADTDFWTGKSSPKKELPPKNDSIPFPRQMVTITGQPLQEVEYRALETAALTIQVTNDFMETHSTLSMNLRGRLDGQHWEKHWDIKTDTGNKIELNAPVGMQDAYLTLFDNEAGRYFPMRFRMADDEPWLNNWYATIGTIERGANRSVEVQPYEPGVLKVACLEPDGKPLPQNGLEIKYRNVAFEDPKIITMNGDTILTGIERIRPSLEFATLDGQPVMWRYHPVLADEEFTLSASGFNDQGWYKPVEQPLTLKSGELHEMTVTLKERAE